MPRVAATGTIRAARSARSKYASWNKNTTYLGIYRDKKYIAEMLGFEKLIKEPNSSMFFIG